MLVVLPFSERDATQAIRLAEWIEQLGGCAQHSCLLVRDARVGPDTVSEILNPLQRAFGSVYRIDYPNDGVNAWPFSCNRMFNRAAKFIELEQPQPFLWLEPDAVPMGAGWLDAIATEYAAAVAAGKLFLGDKVEVENVPLHLSGIAVYPATMSHHAGEALMAQDTAWDVFAAHQIVPKAAWSELILHAWKHPQFESAEQIQREIFDFKPKCVLFHADKSGSLIELLRSESPTGSITQMDSPSRARINEQSASITPTAGTMPRSTPICDILIKSYPADYEWLRYCLQSIGKFGSGFRSVILVVPENEPPPKDTFFVSRSGGFRITYIPVVENGDPYLFQQAVKASAHEFTDADYILHVDSDCVFQRPFSPADFFHDGKPVWYVTPYEAVAVPWRAPTEKFIGERVQFEFMRRLPQLVPRALHLAVAAFCLARHKVRLTDYILSQPDRAFSEFNALGALAWLRDRGDFHWVDTTTVDMPPPFANQYRSYDGITDETRAEIENVLSGGVESRHANVERGPQRLGATSSDAPDSNAGLRNNTSLLESGSGSSAPPAQNLPIRQTNEGWWIIDGDTHISKWVEKDGRLDHDRWLLDQIPPLIPEGGVVVDGGAFIGDHTIAYVERVGPTGKVYAFEPNPVAFECLERNISRVLSFYGHLYNLGLSDRRENVAMRHDPNVGASSIAASSIAASSIAGTVPDSDICAETLDNILLGGHRLDRCDFIKLDVEGCELKALSGAEKTIAKFKPLLLVEVNTGALVRQGTSPQELFKWLEDHGYSHTPIQSLQIVDPPQYDVLCRPVAKPTDNIVQPWRSKPESLDEIMLHASRLKEFCTAPSYTRQVREKLREAGVIK